MQRSKIRADIKFIDKWLGEIRTHPRAQEAGAMLKKYMLMARSDNPKVKKVGLRVLSSIE